MLKRYSAPQEHTVKAEPVTTAPAALSATPGCPRVNDEPPWRGIDKMTQASMARMTGGVSPVGLGLAWLDWATHLAGSPGKLLSLAQYLVLRSPVPSGKSAISRPDPRFRHPGWETWPFCVLRNEFERVQGFWNLATTDVTGVAGHNQKVVNFIARQLVDTLSPSNHCLSNPEALEALQHSGGSSLLQGAQRLWADEMDILAGRSPGTSRATGQVYRVGKEIAATPGVVVYRNDLFELIRYAPQTTEAWREPVLIVPSWILKYYILDLSPHNSLLRYLVKKGHTVFAVSWKNPRDEAREHGLAEYLKDGLLTALDQVARVSGSRRVHAAGYCLGGTLLAIGAATLARNAAKKSLLKSVTLLAAQTDFSEPGELGLFISPSSVASLDALMWQQGYLDGGQLAGVFQLLNSRDLIWSRLTHDYLLGKTLQLNDFMTWNSDQTRLPYRMHSETLHQLYLSNDFAAGRFCVDGKPVALSDVRIPMFVVATEFDHISPWTSVYKMHLQTHNEMTFVLVSGGHNVGIVSEPGRPGRHYRCRMRKSGDSYAAPQEWLSETESADGSWWPKWEAWLARHCTGKAAPAEYPGAQVLDKAPGTYVLEQ